jgi:hypothetical protein
MDLTVFVVILWAYGESYIPGWVAFFASFEFALTSIVAIMRSK